MNQPHWTKEELVAYILLYTAHSNFEEANMERNVIISKVDMQTFQKIQSEEPRYLISIITSQFNAVIPSKGVSKIISEQKTISYSIKTLWKKPL